MGFSIINHPYSGYRIYGKPHVQNWLVDCWYMMILRKVLIAGCCVNQSQATCTGHLCFWQWSLCSFKLDKSLDLPSARHCQLATFCIAKESSDTSFSVGAGWFERRMLQMCKTTCSWIFKDGAFFTIHGTSSQVVFRFINPSDYRYRFVWIS